MKITSTGIAVALSVVVALGLIFFGPSFFTSPSFNLETLSMSEDQQQPQFATSTPELPTTLTVTDLVEGSGPEAAAGDRVAVAYTGMLPDGTIFDSSRSRGPYSFVLGQGSVIAGWEEGILGMKQGGKRTLIIPPSMGYGSQDMGVIPPHSTLLFEVELVSVEKP